MPAEIVKARNRSDIWLQVNVIWTRPEIWFYNFDLTWIDLKPDSTWEAVIWPDLILQIVRSPDFLFTTFNFTFNFSIKKFSVQFRSGQIQSVLMNSDQIRSGKFLNLKNSDQIRSGKIWFQIQVEGYLTCSKHYKGCNHTSQK